MRLEFYCCVSVTLVLRDRSPSTATEPLPRDGAVRGMARPVYVARARNACQQDVLTSYVPLSFSFFYEGI